VIVSLDTRDPLLREHLLDRLTTYVLLYCWRCPVSHSTFSYRLLPSFAVVAYSSGPPSGDFPYCNYPDVFPETPVNLVRATASVGAVDIYKKRPESMIGGDPFLHNGAVPNEPCPSCGLPMRLFAVVWDQAPPLNFADNMYVQLVFMRCSVCEVIAADHALD
jgi:hypothetical protein